MSLIFGALITLVGVLFLGTNLGWWNGIAWEALWALWPIVIILIGLRMVVRNALLFALGAVIILGLAGTMLALSETTNGRLFSTVETAQSSFSQSLAVTETTELKIDLHGYYDITVSGDTGDTVSANLTGPTTFINQLKLEKSGTTIRLSDSDKGRNWDNWHWRNNKITGTIILPTSHALNLGLSGLTNVKVSNHSAKVTVHASGASNTTFSDSTSLDPSIELSGAGKVALDSASGKANFEMSGAGQITTQKATFDSLRIDASGAGKVSIESGSVKDVNLDASGASNISIPKPTGTIDQDTSGASKINFR